MEIVIGSEFHLLAGQVIQFDLQGNSTHSGTLNDPYLVGVYDASGTLIPNTFDDDSGVGNNAQVIFVPVTSGDYYVSAGAYQVGTGTYKLSATLTR